MGQHRQNRAMSDWINNGESLLRKMRDEHKLYNEIKNLIFQLINNEDDTDREKITEELNSKKYELGEIWIKWVRSISQKTKDKERSNFYVNDKIYDEILNFIGLTRGNKKENKKENSDNKIFETLFIHIKGLGVNNTNEIYSLIEELSKFSSAANDRNSKDLLTNEKKHYQGITGQIIHAILKELKRNRITNFEKLKNIRATINKDLNDTNEMLSEENKKLNLRIRNLENKISHNRI
ncbi:hypothetical protein ACRN9G_17680 [Shewanella frigidimarina]|uniref:hypothetical protein n=1 Tax=Shewanella frigidimarina TaxID=56812 RepID=UPI003D7C0B67